VVATGGMASPFLASWYGAAALGAIVGAVGAAVNGGNILKGAFMGALTGALTFGAGQLGLQGLAELAVQGVVGGITSILNGGKFGHGFAAAGLSMIAGGMLKGTKIMAKAAGRMLTRAVVGGTISVITGGKFGNGAVGAAFAQASAEVINSVNPSAGGAKSSQEILSDTENVGAGRELYDGQVIVKKFGSTDSVVTDTELATVNDSLKDIFNKGGDGGAKLQQSMTSGDPTTIILNDEGANAASGYYSRVLTVDLNSNHEFLNLTTSNFKAFSNSRLLAHELGHAVLGKRDVGISVSISVMGKIKTFTPYPNVKFTDGIMKGINGSVRGKYTNFCAQGC